MNRIWEARRAAAFTRAGWGGTPGYVPEDLDRRQDRLLMLQFDDEPMNTVVRPVIAARH